MARAQRALAQTDAHAEAAPASKRVSKGKVKSVEHDAPQQTADQNEPAASTLQHIR